MYCTSHGRERSFALCRCVITCAVQYRGLIYIRFPKKCAHSVVLRASGFFFTGGFPQLQLATDLALLMLSEGEQATYCKQSKTNKKKCRKTARGAKTANPDLTITITTPPQSSNTTSSPSPTNATPQKLSALQKSHEHYLWTNCSRWDSIRRHVLGVTRCLKSAKSLGKCEIMGFWRFSRRGRGLGLGLELIR